MSMWLPEKNPFFVKKAVLVVVAFLVFAGSFFFVKTTEAWGPCDPNTGADCAGNCSGGTVDGTIQCNGTCSSDIDRTVTNAQMCVDSGWDNANGWGACLGSCECDPGHTWEQWSFCAGRGNTNGWCCGSDGGGGPVGGCGDAICDGSSGEDCSSCPTDCGSCTITEKCPSNYSYCASEGYTCDFSGTQSVSYGANGSYAYKVATNSIGCNNGVFGDPIYGTTKSCCTKPLPTASLLVNGTTSATLAYGQQATLSWSSTGATSCWMSGGGIDGWKSIPTGSGVVAPATTTQYSFQCFDDGGNNSNTSSVTVNVLPYPTASFTGVPSTIRPGQSSTLTITKSADVVWCQIHQWVPSNGTWPIIASGNISNFVVSPAETTQYSMNCHNNYVWTGWVGTTVTVTVDPPLTPASITGSCPSPGTTGTLTWTPSLGATSYALRLDDYTLSGWNGSCNPANGAGDICENTALTSRSFTGTPGSNYNAWVHACNASGCSGAASVAFSCATPLPSLSLTANPISVTSGNSSTLTRTSANATWCWAWTTDTTGNPTVDPSWSGFTANPTGTYTQSVAPASSTVYKMECGDALDRSTGVQQATVTVTYLAPVITTFTINGSTGPVDITQGQPRDFEWTTANATACNASSSDGWSGPKSTSGASEPNMNATTSSIHTLTCTGPGGSVSRSVQVNVSCTPIAGTWSVCDCATETKTRQNNLAANCTYYDDPPVACSGTEKNTCRDSSWKEVAP